MEIPITFEFSGTEFNVHFIFETLAFLIGFRFYVWLRRSQKDSINSENRLWIILGAALGALIGSRLLGALENPQLLMSVSWLSIYKSKTIMGGLLGGLIAVESTKKILGVKQSSGDLFVFPLILGISIGRIGCFLTGVIEPTFGIPTTFFMGMDLGDGLLRHPTALYEILFLILLGIGLTWTQHRLNLKNGSLFKIFMVCYFLFRFNLEFIKPHYYEWLSLTSIQWACLLCFVYYYKVFFSPKSLIL